MERESPEKRRAIQDYYPAPFRFCFGCGPDHPSGWHIASYPQGEEVVARFAPASDLTGGVPDFAYGGMLAAILDCHGNAAGAWFHHRARGLTLGQETLTRCVTAELTVRYLRPTPLGTPLQLTAQLASLDGRKVRLAMTVSADGEKTCEAEMLAIAVKNSQQ